MSVSPSACIARPATFDDLAEIGEMLHRIFGVRQTVETLRWKLTGDAGRLIGSAVLTRNRRIVGFLGQIPTRVHIAGRAVLATQGTDAGILEEYRRLDTFLGMVQASVQDLRAAGVALTYGTTSADAGTLMTELFGLKRLAPIPLLVRPLSPVETSLGRGARLFAQFLSVCDRWGERDPSVLRGRFRLSRIGRFDPRFDRFWHEIQPDYPALVVRDAAHLNWRYVDTPNIVYERQCIESALDGHIQGYVVLGLRRYKGRLRGHLADLVTARSGNATIANRLIRSAIGWLRTQAVEVAEVWAFPHTPLRRALLGHGFIPRRTGAGGFHVNALTPGVEPDGAVPEQAKKWFLSMGDSDTV